MKKLLDVTVCIVIIPLLLLLGRLPRRCTFLGCIGLVFVLTVGLRRWKKVALRNLEIAFPELSLKERQQILRRANLILAENLSSFCRSSRMDTPALREEFDVSNLVQAMQAAETRSQGNGVLCLTFHFGATEGIVQAMAVRDCDFDVMARYFELPLFDRWWKGRREIFGNRMFPRKGGFIEVRRRLLAGKRVAVMVDQNVKSNYATFVNFFGMQASATKAIALALLKTKAPAVFAVPIQIADGKWKMWVRDLPHPSEFPGSDDEKAQQFMQRVHDYGEEVIRQYPEHWFWVHRRFKTRPPGEPETVYQGI